MSRPMHVGFRAASTKSPLFFRQLRFKSTKQEQPLAGTTVHGARSTYKILDARGGTSYYARLREPNQDFAYATTHSHAIVKEVHRAEGAPKQDPDMLKACRHVRQVQDTVPNVPSGLSSETVDHRVVLDAMDHRLEKVRPYRGRWSGHRTKRKSWSHPKLPAMVARAVLETLDFCQQVGLVFTGVNIRNIFVSGLSTEAPIIKIGDFSDAIPEEYARTRSDVFLPMVRAPEVWKNAGASYDSAVWALGATMGLWLVSPHPLGLNKKMVEAFGDSGIPTLLNRTAGPIEYSEDSPPERNGVKAGKIGSRTDNGKLREALSHTQYLARSDNCTDFMHSLLVADPAKRPTAEMALKHPFVARIRLR